MARSNPSPNVLALGKRLASQLDSDESDLLARWMSHHIAQLVATAEKAAPRDRAKAESACATAIIKLWTHRNSLPRQVRPLKDNEVVLDMLARLAPASTRNLYFEVPRHAAREKVGDPVGQQWLDVAESVDYAARQIIRWCLGAASRSAGADTTEWLKLADDSGLSDQQMVTIRIALGVLEPPKPEELRRKQREGLEEMVAKLRAMAVFSEMIAAEVQSDIQSKPKA